MTGRGPCRFVAPREARAGSGVRASDDLRCGGLRTTLIGTARADRITGTRRRDVIAVLDEASPDQLAGGASTGQLVGGSGNDTLRGGGGPDVLNAGNGRLDRAIGGAGADSCTGRRLLGC